jgi:uncharacterized protein YprB with RNaseH-like and TPR domain
LSNPNALIIDIETALAILKRGEQPEINPVTGEPYRYANGFDDHDNPPAVTGVWDCYEGKPVRFYFQEQLPDLQKLVDQRQHVVTFNGDSFDLPKLARYGCEVPRWKSVDLAALLNKATHMYCKLDDLARVNLGTSKSGNGAEAPKLWQRYQADPRGRLCDLWELVDYAMNDVWITWRLYMRALRNGELNHPRTGGPVRLSL